MLLALRRIISIMCGRRGFPGCEDNPLEIGKRLCKLRIAKDLLTVTTKGIILLTNLKKNLAELILYQVHPENASGTNSKYHVESLLALISEAKLPDDEG